MKFKDLSDDFDISTIKIRLFGMDWKIICVERSIEPVHTFNRTMYIAGSQRYTLKRTTPMPPNSVSEMVIDQMVIEGAEVIIEVEGLEI